MKVFHASCQIRKIMRRYKAPREQELTDRFISLLCENHRIRSYETCPSYEAKIGADWLWLIFTNAGISAFLVQAKKLDQSKQELSRTQAAYISNSGNKQIDLLLKTSSETRIPAIYVLYSDQIEQVLCGSRHPLTKEGVFFDTAENIYAHFFGSGNNKLRHMPISCMFACFSHECHYYDTNKVCESCKNCIIGRTHRCRDIDNSCLSPFYQFFQQNYRQRIPLFPIEIKNIPLLYCHSILEKHPDYLPIFLNDRLADVMQICSRVIITDYRNRHDKLHASSIMGPDFVIDRIRIYTKTDIMNTLRAMKKKYRTIRKIGLFGSYARTEATPDSDIDVAIVYNQHAFDNELAFTEISDFVVEMLKHFQKNIDFVDYQACKENPACDDFLEDISKDLTWA